jgi:hypothetical protein
MAEHGTKAVRDRVAALLRADLPNRIDAVTHLWSLDRREIPKPDMIISGEKPDQVLDDKGKTWIEVITPRVLPRTQSMGLNAHGSMVHRYRHSARIYVYVISPEWADTVDMRDRSVTMVHDSLLSYPTLAIPPQRGDTGFLVHVNTITEESGEPFRIGQRTGGNPRVRAGGLLSYEIEHEYANDDPNTTQPWGTFETLDLRVTLLPFTAPVGG